jgi:hypothetical protein
MDTYQIVTILPQQGLQKHLQMKEPVANVQTHLHTNLLLLCLMGSKIAQRRTKPKEMKGMVLNWSNGLVADGEIIKLVQCLDKFLNHNGHYIQK